MRRFHYLCCFLCEIVIIFLLFEVFGRLLHEFFSSFLQLLFTYILSDGLILDTWHFTYELRVDEIKNTALYWLLMFLFKDVN
jgi:hypothetical protein